MYAFLDRIDADAFEAIAAQAYVEMLKAGYTAVAEFHYVHHDPQGKPYADPAELAHRIVAAAGTRASRSRCSRCSMRTRISAARSRRRDSGASCIRSIPTRTSWRARARSRVGRLHARDRAAQSPRRDAGRARSKSSP
jgi:hypothetical protein